MAQLANSSYAMQFVSLSIALILLSAAPFAQGMGTCEPDPFQISCMVDPCTTTMCKAFPQASCEACYSASCPCCAIYSMNGEEVDCDAPTDAMCNTPCTDDYMICPDGSTLYRYPELGCQFPGCPPCSQQQCCGGNAGGGGISACECLMDPDTYCPYDCDTGMSEKLITKCACADLTNEVNTFGDCQTPLGVAIVNGECIMVSGCSLPEGLQLYSSVEECQSACSLLPCPEDSKTCACGSSLNRLPELGCNFPLCPEDHAKQDLCSEGETQCECDLFDVFFGLCEIVLGYGVVGGSCQAISGCPSVVPEHVQLFATYEECATKCPSALCSHGALVQCQQGNCISEMCPRNKAAACVECEEGSCDTLAYVNDTILSQIQCNCGCGDINDDGALNVLDVTASISLVQFAKGEVADSDMITSVCGEQEVDLNKDGAANVLDLVKMLNVIQGEASPMCSS